MNIIRSLDEMPNLRNAVVTTGSFDGVHAGHQKILKRLQLLAQKYDGVSVVITFDPHPREVIYPGDKSLRLLTLTDEKLKYFEQYGVDYAVILPFTVEFSQLSAREYVEKFLIGRFHPSCLVVGYDHKFGLNREGDYNLLNQYARSGAFELVRISKHEVDEITISSSKIREALLAGNIKIANQSLNHPYTISGKVVHGQKIGNAMGYPTANIQPASNKKLLPPPGVYACTSQIHDRLHHGMLYIGTRPTINPQTTAISIEVHFFDFDEDIYGQKIAVEIIDFIRSDQTLDDVEQLRSQIALDALAVQDVLKGIKSDEETSVAIVALNYNGAEVLPVYLPSFSTDRVGTEVYVADNGSTDSSLAYINEHFPRIRVIELEQNYGFAEGYNKALEGLGHKYLALVNTDVELTQGWLDPIIQLMEDHPEIAVCQPKILDAKDKSRFEYAGGCGGFLDIVGYPFCAGRILNDVEEDSGQYDNAVDIFWSSGAAFVVRSDLFYATGGFDKDYFAHQEEIDLCWTLKRAGYRIVSVPSSVVYHEGGATLPYHNPKKVFLNFRNNLATLFKHLGRARLFVVLPVRALLDLMACLNFLTRGQLANALAVARAYIAFLGWLPALGAKRRRLKTTIDSIRIGPSNTSGLYNGSILIQYYLLGRRTFSSLSIGTDAPQTEVGNTV